jgi:hypothetical protein
MHAALFLLRCLTFSAPSFLSLADIHNLFGPTIAGQYSEDKTRYIIQYPVYFL